MTTHLTEPQTGLPPDFGAAARTEAACKVYGTRADRGPCPRRRHRRLPSEALHGDHGPVRLGQVDPAALLAGLDDLTSGHALHRRHRPEHARRQGAHAAAPGPDRLHLPGLQPDADADRAGEHRRCRCASPAASRTRPGSTGSSRPSGCSDRLQHRPTELSGGQQQRVAVARALADAAADHLRRRADGQPRLHRRAPRCSSFMRSAVDEIGQTIVMVTHDPTAASYADRVVFLADGRIVDEMRAPDRRPGARAHEAVRGVTADAVHDGQGAHRPQAPALRDRPGGHPRRGVHGRHAGPDRHRHQDLRRPLRRRLPEHRRRRARRRGLRRRHRSRGAAGPGRRVGARRRASGARRRRGRGWRVRLRPPRRQGRQARSGTRPPERPPSACSWPDDARAQPVPARGRARARRGRRGRHRRPQCRRRQAGASATRRRSSSRDRRGTCTVSGIAKFGTADSPGGATVALFTGDRRPAAGRRARQVRHHLRRRRRRASSQQQVDRRGREGHPDGHGGRDRRRVTKETQDDGARGDGVLHGPSCSCSPWSPCSSAPS